MTNQFDCDKELKWITSWGMSWTLFKMNGSSKNLICDCYANILRNPEPVIGEFGVSTKIVDGNQNSQKGVVEMSAMDMLEMTCRKAWEERGRKRKQEKQTCEGKNPAYTHQVDDAVSTRGEMGLLMKENELSCLLLNELIQCQLNEHGELAGFLQETQWMPCFSFQRNPLSHKTEVRESVKCPMRKGRVEMWKDCNRNTGREGRGNRGRREILSIDESHGECWRAKRKWLSEEGYESYFRQIGKVWAELRGEHVQHLWDSMNISAWWQHEMLSFFRKKKREIHRSSQW